MAKVQLSGYKCERCGHEWVPRGSDEPRVCPKCKSPYWNVPKKKGGIVGRKDGDKKKPSNSKTRR